MNNVNNNRKFGKKGFLAGIIPNVFTYFIMILIIILFHLVFSFITDTNNNKISFDNEPTILASSILYSFLESEIDYQGLKCFNDNEEKSYRYSIRDLLYAFYTCNEDIPGSKFNEVLAFIDENSDVEINTYLEEDGRITELKDMTIFSRSKKRCTEKESYDSDAYTYIPVKEGLVKIEVIVKQYSDKLSCLAN